MVDPSAGPVDGTVDGELPNVGDMPLAELVRSKDTALDRAVQRVLREAELSEGNYAAFGNVP